MLKKLSIKFKRGEKEKKKALWNIGLHESEVCIKTEE